MRNKILLLGSGELGKEFVIACQRLGQFVIAVDNYADAPAMHVANTFEVIDMLNPNCLQDLVEKYKPDIIVPEIEAIRTEKLFEFEKKGIHVVPSARAVNYTMNRKAIRDLACIELGLKTANYKYAKSIQELEHCVEEIGLPCVIKPLMSSSGKGQSILRKKDDILNAWNVAIEGSRGDLREVIVEEFIHFDYEITLLTVTQKNKNTLFCPPIGHRQEGGDYQESWQPVEMSENVLFDAKEMARKVTENLGGYGIWGVEFFIAGDQAYFSELSPRPHDTGMVTLAGTQNFNEFELHARAILGLTIPYIKLQRKGASAVIKANKSSKEYPLYEGLESASIIENSDFRIFGKPSSRPNRRMGVALSFGEDDIVQIIEQAKYVASKIKCQ